MVTDQDQMQTSCTFHPTMTATQQRTNHGSTDQTLWPACSHCLLALLLVKYDPWSLLRAQVQTSHGLWLSTRRRTVQVQWYVYDYLLPRCATSQLPAHTSSALCYYGTHLQPGNKSLKPKQAEHPSFEIWIRKVNLGENPLMVESIALTESRSHFWLLWLTELATPMASSSGLEKSKGWTNRFSKRHLDMQGDITRKQEQHSTVLMNNGLIGLP